VNFENQPSLRGRVNRVLARAGWPRIRTSSEEAVLASSEPIAQAVASSAAAAAERWALERDDLLQVARLGLLLGYREWDPGRGRLEAWLARRAYQEVISWLRWTRRRQEEVLAESIEDSAEDDQEGGNSRSLAEVLADPSQDLDEVVGGEPRRRLARAIARAAARAGEEAETLLDRLVEAWEARDDALADQLRERLKPVVSAAMAEAIREKAAAGLRRPRRVA
jgi:DNA-directed RNA polymerase specialized sigma24 family protein